MTKITSAKELSILVVDDIFTNRLLLHEVIGGLGCKCDEVENGKLAIEFIQNNHVDIVFMDIEMPVMNGIETTQYIRSKLPPKLANIPIVALTAHNPIMFFDDYGDVGFDKLMTKPYSIDKIKNLIDEVKNKNQG